ncbi:unnamed protein product [Meganyctiphanes norvegica]|uniref:Uncharacterized protein n=1 Tax=Meganyctiphanes norvegica TaxID=48144 RepID=A0AAV2R2D8_MEGNR
MTDETSVSMETMKSGSNGTTINLRSRVMMKDDDLISDVRARLLQDDDLTTDEDVEYERCRIKRDWEAEEGGSLIGRSIFDHAMESEAANVRCFTKIFTLTQMIGEIYLWAK